jgi:hypothetical protein
VSTFSDIKQNVFSVHCKSEHWQKYNYCLTSEVSLWIWTKMQFLEHLTLFKKYNVHSSWIIQHYWICS